MKKCITKFFRVVFTAAIIASMMAVTVSGAVTSSRMEKFRTATISQLLLTKDSKVEVVRGGHTMEAYEGMRLTSGDRLRTVGDATVYILIDQNKLLRMDGASEAELTNTLLRNKVKITLVSGIMFFNVMEKLSEEESLVFNYGRITVSVRGTSSIMKAEGDAFAMTLCDGVVEVSEEPAAGAVGADGQPAKPQVYTVNPGTKFEYTPGLSEDGSASVVKTSPVTISELPKSVINELLKDEDLKARVMDSVPESNGPGGPRYLTNPEAIEHMGKSDTRAMEFSDEIKENDPELVKQEEEKKEAKQQAELETEPEGQAYIEPETEPETQPATEPETSPSVEPTTEPTSESQTETTPTETTSRSQTETTTAESVECGECHTVFSNADFNNTHTLGCKEHYACEITNQTELWKHVKLTDTCGDALCSILDGSDDWKEHFQVDAYKNGSGTTTKEYICKLSGNDQFFCPGCNQSFMVSAMDTYKANHLVYKNGWLYCNNSPCNKNTITALVQRAGNKIGTTTYTHIIYELGLTLVAPN